MKASTAKNKDAVESYNRDDCLSTLGLRNWLERVRYRLLQTGETIERPASDVSVSSEALSDWQIIINRLVERITTGIPVNFQERSEEQQARWTLAHVLDWHRREEKALWWEYFRLRDLSSEELIEERSGLSGFEFMDAVGGSSKAPIHRYKFLAQETEFRRDESLHKIGGSRVGSVHAISFDDRTIDIKKRVDTAAVHPEAVFAHNVIDTKVLANSLIRLGEYVAGLIGLGPFQAGRDLLLRLAPRIGSHPIQYANESALEAALRIAPKLTGGVLPVQGPPGSGKTFTGARMICELIRAGKRVGITANSHKVIRNLLDEVLRPSDENGMNIRCIQKVQEAEPDKHGITFTSNNADIFNELKLACCVAAGTPWLWSREEAFETVDVLVVDEAAQMSLANVLAISQAAKSIILLGDPQPTSPTPAEFIHRNLKNARQLWAFAISRQSLGSRFGNLRG